VRGRMLVGRRVTAAHLSGRHAQPQMNRTIAGCKAIDTAIRLWCHIADLIEMITGRHMQLPLSTERLFPFAHRCLASLRPDDSRLSPLPALRRGPWGEGNECQLSDL